MANKKKATNRNRAENKAENNPDIRADKMTEQSGPPFYLRGSFSSESAPGKTAIDVGPILNPKIIQNVPGLLLSWKPFGRTKNVT